MVHQEQLQPPVFQNTIDAENKVGQLKRKLSKTKLWEFGKRFRIQQRITNLAVRYGFKV